LQVLITGASGFIGKQLSRRLLQDGYEVLEVDISGSASIYCDLTDLNQVQDLFSQHSPEIIIHLAAISSTSKSYEKEALAMNINVMSTVNVLLSAKNLNPNLEYFIFASSAEVYGGLDPYRFQEDDIPQPLTPYATSKVAAETFVLMKNRNLDLKTCCIRFCNTFGRTDNVDFIVEYLFDCFLKNSNPVLKTPYSVREFMYVPDHLRIYDLALRKRPTGILNASSGDAYNISQLASKIKELTASKCEIKTIFNSPVTNITLNIDKLKNFGFRFRYSLDDGLQNFYEKLLMMKD
jgi:nucleoside-diphosphate-sugar epimerase